METFLKVCVYILLLVWGIPYTQYFLHVYGQKPVLVVVAVLIAISARRDFKYSFVAAFVALLLLGTYFYNIIGGTNVCCP